MPAKLPVAKTTKAVQKFTLYEDKYCFKYYISPFLMLRPHNFVCAWSSLLQVRHCDERHGCRLLARFGCFNLSSQEG